MSQEKITVDLKSKSYNIYIKENLKVDISSYLKDLKIGKKILIVSEDKIPSSYSRDIYLNLKKIGYQVFLLKLANGESSKNINSLLKIVKFAVKNKFERKDTFLSLGGGVVSDLTGFSASIYYRGINFISIPTSLLAMVDASIGGKTAVNIPEGKNLLGTFYQPRVVLIDPLYLKSLPKSELLIGLAEVIKYALLEKTAVEAGFKPAFKRSFFEYLKNNKNKILKLDKTAIKNIISYSAKVKASIVSRDEKESNLRAILNLGHTFAHGIEQAYNYKGYTHGEAVSIGMCLASKLALKRGLINENIAKEIINLISDYGLPTSIKKPIKSKIILQSMLLDKKVENGKLKFILPYGSIGKVKIVNDIDLKNISDLII